METHIVTIKPPLQIVDVGNGCKAYSTGIYIPAKSELTTTIQSITRSYTPYGVTKFAGTTFPSVLKKLTAVSESLAHQKFYFCYRED